MSPPVGGQLGPVRFTVDAKPQAETLRMFKKRLRGYRAIGYARGEAPLGISESTYEPFVEYDDGAETEAPDMFS